MSSLLGNVAIITGASRGIGHATALRLARDGAAIVASARDSAALDSLARQIESAGGRCAAIPLDLRLPGAPQRLAEFALATFGHIDIVVNNAGATKRGDFLTLTDDDWADGFALKFYCAVRLTRAAWPQLKHRKGSVVNISGIGGRTPGAEFSIGGSVNAAMLSLTKALAELGIRDGVQVNAISPGAVRTGRLDARLARIVEDASVTLAEAERRFAAESGIARVGEPEDIASLIAYLVSQSGRFLQGSLIDIDGGQTKTI